MSLRKAVFATPQDAEAAFYEALQRADLDALMAVWSEDEEIICILPGGPRLVGYADIREAWRRIFESGRRFTITLSQPVILQGVLMSVHNLHEEFSLHGNKTGETAPVIATNIYVRSTSGWRMLMHHASPTLSASEKEISKTLH